MAADGAVSGRLPTTPYILVGFAGGFVRHDDLHHGPVQLAERIRQGLPKNASIQVFENRHRKAAYKSIIELLDTNHDGILSDAEKAQAHIILFGHSWGASAVVMLARELDRAGIPVLLTVQVDSVAKPWQRDKVIPENVAAAVNFYQPHGLIHGRSQIVAADDSKTQILGNYRFDYQKDPCSARAARGSNTSSLRTTCRASAILGCGHRLKAWCSSEWNHNPPRSPQFPKPHSPHVMRGSA